MPKLNGLVATVHEDGSLTGTIIKRLKEHRNTVCFARIGLY